MSSDIKNRKLFFCGYHSTFTTNSHKPSRKTGLGICWESGSKHRKSIPLNPLRLDHLKRKTSTPMSTKLYETYSVDMPNSHKTPIFILFLTWKYYQLLFLWEFHHYFAKIRHANDEEKVGIAWSEYWAHKKSYHILSDTSMRSQGMGI